HHPYRGSSVACVHGSSSATNMLKYDRLCRFHRSTWGDWAEEHLRPRIPPSHGSMYLAGQRCEWEDKVRLQGRAKEAGCSRANCSRCSSAPLPDLVRAADVVRDNDDMVRAGIRAAQVYGASSMASTDHRALHGRSHRCRSRDQAKYVGE